MRAIASLAAAVAVCTFIAACAPEGQKFCAADITGASSDTISR